MRLSTALIEKYLCKGHTIYDVNSFRQGMACLAEELYPQDENRILNDRQLLLMSDCMDLNNGNF